MDWVQGMTARPTIPLAPEIFARDASRAVDETPIKRPPRAADEKSILSDKCMLYETQCDTTSLGDENEEEQKKEKKCFMILD